jgi:hypothetical protein
MAKNRKQRDTAAEVEDCLANLTRRRLKGDEQ